MKKFFVISNLVLFMILVIMTYFMYFSPIAFLISLACFILAVVNSGLTKGKLLIAVYLFEAVISIFLFLANGPFMLDWLIGGISLLQVGVTWLCQIVFLMLVLGLMMNKHVWIERFFVPKT